jgi:hypothetical protein
LFLQEQLKGIIIISSCIIDHFVVQLLSGFITLGTLAQLCPFHHAALMKRMA